MAEYWADLHVHTVLSPCAEVEMIPPLIVERAVEVGLDILAVTDHNSAENAEAVIRAASGSSLKIIPGIECESVEGVHLVCLFDRLEDAVSMQETVYANLPDLKNREETFGPQFVVDQDGEFVRHNERLLLIPTELPMVEIAECVASLNGLVIPAHVDRPSYGIYGVLGFMPEEPRFDIVELSRHISAEEAVAKYPDLAGRAIFHSSDAHRLDEIGQCRTRLELSSRTVAEIVRATARKT